MNIALLSSCGNGSMNEGNEQVAVFGDLQYIGQQAETPLRSTVHWLFVVLAMLLPKAD